MDRNVQIKYAQGLFAHQKAVEEMLRKTKELYAAYDDEFAQATRERHAHLKEYRSKQKHDIPEYHTGMQDFVVSRMNTMKTGFMPQHLRPIVAEKISMLEARLEELNRAIEAVSGEETEVHESG